MGMVRYRRQLLRLYLLLVICMGLFGGWYASQNWQLETLGVEEISLTGDGDWIDFFATLGEETLQLFLGFTSEQ